MDESTFPIAACKQIHLKLDSCMLDMKEIILDPAVSDEVKQSFNVMYDMAGTMMTSMLKIVGNECDEVEFIKEEIPMEDIESFAEACSEELTTFGEIIIE